MKRAYVHLQCTFAPDIECGIQIFWTANRGAVSQWTIVKEEKDCGYWANNFSLGNGCAIHGSKDLNARLNVGGKSNWVWPMKAGCRDQGAHHVCTSKSQLIYLKEVQPEIHCWENITVFDNCGHPIVVRIRMALGKIPLMILKIWCVWLKNWGRGGHLYFEIKMATTCSILKLQKIFY